MRMHKKGMTMMEVILVLVIIAIATAFALPNYSQPTEQARAATAKNNLLAIYSAQKNYFNNNAKYCYDTGAGTCGDSLADLDTNLSLEIQDDGTYLYDCPNNSNTCTATRNSGSNLVLTITFNTPAQPNSGLANPNPTCTSTTGNAPGGGGPDWCPF